MPIALTGGGFKKPDGTNLSGILILRLPQDAKVTAANNQIAPDQINVTVTNGALVPGTSIYGTDELTPSGLYYSVMLENSNGRIIYGYDPPQKWQPTGGGTLDVGSIIPLSVTPAVSVNILPSPIQIGQTDTGLSRTAAGTLAVGNGTSGDKSGIVIATSFSDASAAPAGVGVLRVGNNTNAVVGRNFTNSADLPCIGIDAINRVFLGTSAGTDPVIIGGSLTVASIKSAILNGAASGNSIIRLDAQGPLGAVTGNSADQTIYTSTITANTAAVNRTVRLSCVVTHFSGAAGILYKLVIGSTTVFSVTLGAGANARQRFEVNIFMNGSQASQAIDEMIYDGTTIAFDNTQTATENFANAITIKMTANVANTDTYIPNAWRLDYIQ